MNKKYIYLFITLLLISACERTVDDWQEGFLLETVFENNDQKLFDYNAVNENNKQIVWREEFDNNNSKWPVDTSIYSIISKSGGNHYHTIFPVHEFFKTVQMSDGYLKIYHNRNDKRIAIPFTIDEGKNFEIEMKTYISDDIVGRSQPRIIFEFSVFDNLRYRLFLYKWNNNVDIVLDKNENNFQYFDWNSLEYLELSKVNTFTVRKIDEKYAFFINHKLFYILSDKEFSCNKSYIVLCEGVEYMFDYVRVSYIR